MRVPENSLPGPAATIATAIKVYPDLILSLIKRIIEPSSLSTDPVLDFCQVSLLRRSLPRSGACSCSTAFGPCEFIAEIDSVRQAKSLAPLVPLFQVKKHARTSPRQISQNLSQQASTQGCRRTLCQAYPNDMYRLNWCFRFEVC